MQTHATRQESQRRQPSPPRRPPPRFQRMWRQCGELPKRTKHTAAAELTPWTGRALDIIIAPLDGKFRGVESEYQTLIDLYKLPDEFVWERERGVTHSFGHQLGEDGHETLWMHFLAEIPQTNSPNRQPEWLKWGFVLMWLPTANANTTSQPSGSTAAPEFTYKVALIVFEPPVETLERLVHLLQSSDWTDATVDPYVLVDVALVSWYHRIDKIAWEVTDLVRTDEKDIFRRARMLQSNESTIADLDLHQIHTSAKNAVFMLEALDAAIRLVDMALLGHESLRQRSEKVWGNTHRRLRHRNELFQSTKLRTISSQARIKNTVDLAFHINTAHDSRVNLKNSRSVRLISIVGMVFMPFSAMTSIFGTQFFTSAGLHMEVNPDFWLLWVIAIPVTLIILAVWQVTEHDSLKLWQRGSVWCSLRRWPLIAGRNTNRKSKSGTMVDVTELRDMELLRRV